MVSVVSFSIILWELSAPLTLFGFEISRAMIFITYVYVTIATVIAFKIGHPLVRLHFPQRAVQRVLSIHFGPLARQRREHRPLPRRPGRAGHADAPVRCDHH